MPIQAVSFKSNMANVANTNMKNDEKKQNQHVKKENVLEGDIYDVIGMGKASPVTKGLTSAATSFASFWALDSLLTFGISKFTKKPAQYNTKMSLAINAAFALYSGVSTFMNAKNK